jgi:acetylornithine deacetylase/succinyl-diaminopimelate desuccinylase-like protein
VITLADLLLSIHGIEVSGPSISTVIPREAKAKVSIRTGKPTCLAMLVKASSDYDVIAVPDMSLKATSSAIIKFVEARFAELGSEGNSISVTIDSVAPWWIADRNHPYSKAAEQAIHDECGVSQGSWSVQTSA